MGLKERYSWDKCKPNGAPQKLLCVDQLKSLVWKSQTVLRRGVAATYQVYFLRQDESSTGS